MSSIAGGTAFLIVATSSIAGSVLTLLEATSERDGTIHKASLLQMDNAIFAFFYEGAMKMGTLAVSTPGLRGGAAATSSVLLGGKYLIAARALAERSAAMFNKMSLISLNTSLSEGEALRVYSSLLDKARAAKGGVT